MNLDDEFVALFDEHRNVVFSTALRLSGSWADAEDLAAETFLRAYRAMASYDADRIAGLQVRPWLLTILKNLWRNTVRSSMRHPESLLEPPEQPTAGIEEQAALETDMAALLRELPETQRLAVVLRHVADLPMAEVAGVLGVSEGTAKSHVFRGLQRLRTLQKEQGP